MRCRTLRSDALALFASVALLAGCSTGVPMDVLDGVSPSMETTASTSRSVIPRSSVGSGANSLAAVVGLVERTEQRNEERSISRAQPVTAYAALPGIVRQAFGDTKPIDFGRVTPQDHLVHGVDVSRWQGTIDWETLRKQGANFAYIKATDGGDHLDPMFQTNWRGAAAAGIARGAYHFFYWCRSGEEQAEWFIRNVPKELGALPPVIDVEWNHQSACNQTLTPRLVISKMKAFMDRVERHYGQRPVIYATPDFYADNLRGQFKDYPFWLRSVSAHPSERYPDREWVFWQYSGTGLSNGVTGEIDLNVFRGDKRQWHDWLIANGVVPLVASN